MELIIIEIVLIVTKIWLILDPDHPPLVLQSHGWRANIFAYYVKLHATDCTVWWGPQGWLMTGTLKIVERREICGRREKGLENNLESN